MSLLDPQVWGGKCFDGSWFVPLGGDQPVVEPATGAELGRVGVPTADDVKRAGAPAAEAQKAWASFLHQGQICMTAGRHLVHESVVDDYVEGLAARADRLPVGNPATEPVALGPIIDEDRRDWIHQLVTSSVDAGAGLVAGGTYEGLFYRPPS